MSAFFNDDTGAPFPEIDTVHAFVQYKGTDICMDFYCECGAHCHFDGFFAHAVECPHCHEKWEMPPLVVPRKVCAGTYQYHVDNAKMLDEDEDFNLTPTSPSELSPTQLDDRGEE